MYEKLFSLKDDAAYSACLQRIYEATSCSTQTELAEYLDVRLSILSDAKRRKLIPATVFMLLLHKLWLNPFWVLTGEGAQYVQPTEIQS